MPRCGFRGAAINHGAAPCISFGGLRVDAAIEREIVRVLTPGAIAAACAAATETATSTATAQRAVELELREAGYEAERVRRQYDLVEPEQRLAALAAEAEAVVLPDPLLAVTV